MGLFCLIHRDNPVYIDKPNSNLLCVLDSVIGNINIASSYQTTSYIHDFALTGLEIIFRDHQTNIYNVTNGFLTYQKCLNTLHTMHNKHFNKGTNLTDGELEILSTIHHFIKDRFDKAKIQEELLN